MRPPFDAVAFGGPAGMASLWPGTANCLHMNVVLMTVMLLASFQSQGAAPVRTVAAVDLDRYLGDWFEIARLPNRFQRTCASDVRASYARRADGSMEVVNRCRNAAGGSIEARGVARIADALTFAKLKVRFAPAALSFLPFVWGDYWILGLADDYSWAVVGAPGRNYLWILGRTPMLPAEHLATAIEVARANGFDVALLVKTTHTSAP